MKLECRVKVPVIATRWMKHGDHPSVQVPPENVNIPGVDKNTLGMIVAPNGSASIFHPNTWVIESGGNVFVVDDGYFNEYYEILHEIKDEEVKDAEVPQEASSD